MSKEETKKGKTETKVEEKGKEIERVEHKNIYAALSAFHGEVSTIKKDQHVNFKAKNSDAVVDYWYATLGVTFDEVNPVLSKHGLCVHHQLHKDGIEAFLIHETAETKREIKDIIQTESEEEKEVSKITSYCDVQTNIIRSGKLALDLTKPEMKDVGAQITYGRRYTLSIVLGIATDDDKDVQLIDEKRGNTEKFAFKQVKERLLKAEGEELEKQIEFIKEEIARCEKGEAPSLGLEKGQYKELLTLAEKQKKAAGSVDAKK